MDEINDGGSAFPWGHNGSRYGGMTLRDYFAAKAMQAMLQQYKFVQTGIPPSDSTERLFSEISACSFVMAEIMVSSRDIVQWPVDGVELTRDDILKIARETKAPFHRLDQAERFTRAVIAAHEAKKAGGGV